MSSAKPSKASVTSEKVVPFNPLTRRNLGASVAEAMLLSHVYPLGEVAKFTGAGIYAIYYIGDFPAYKPIAERNRDGQFNAPIYVGKAVPEGSRQGLAVSDHDDTEALRGRIGEHAGSIRAVQRHGTAVGIENLRLNDFFCRYLVVEDIWIPLGESLLISKFSPLWNQFLDGFGNHAPGSGRKDMLRPRWDSVHTGRAWAAKLRSRDEIETVGQILGDVANHLASITFPGTAHVLQPPPSQMSTD